MDNNIFIPAICPQCGAKIQLAKNLEKGFCSFCGTEIIIKDIVQKIKILNNPTFENYIKLANRSYENEDYLKALDYYTKALELNADNWEAIYKEGFCIAFSSRPEDLSLEKAITSSINAINSLGEERMNDEHISKIKIEIGCNFLFLISHYIITNYNFYINSEQNEEAIDRYWAMLFVTRKAILYSLNELFSDETIDLYPKLKDGSFAYNYKVELMKCLITTDVELCEVRKYFTGSGFGPGSTGHKTIDKDFQKELLLEYDYYIPIILASSPDYEVIKINRKQRNSIFA